LRTDGWNTEADKKVSVKCPSQDEEWRKLARQVAIHEPRKPLMDIDHSADCDN